VYSLSLVGIGGVPLWFTVQFALIRCAFGRAWVHGLCREPQGVRGQGLVSVFIGWDSLCIRCVFAVIGWDWLGLVGIGWVWLGIAVVHCSIRSDSLCFFDAFCGAFIIVSSFAGFSMNRC
jgi:hypothetical protein